MANRMVNPGRPFPQRLQRDKNSREPERYEDTEDEEIDHIEGRPPLEKKSECHIGIRLRAATIRYHILHSKHAMTPPPLYVLNELGDVSAHSALLSQSVLTPAHH